MNKNDLINAISEDSGLSKKDAKSALESVINNISGSLKSGNSVQLIGFGTFSVAKRAAKKGVNPATRQPINIPACNTVKFKCGSALKSSVN
ncbi:MAG: HU family DNA-binding protein [Nitrospinae bacterium]|nr:HU family DNA-binding protein [Nitrospinota bacterium]